MVGVLVTSHGDLCKGLLSAAAMVTGELRQVEAVGLYPGESVETYQEKLKDTVQRLDNGAGVLVLADLRGGTPYNRTVAMAKAMSLNVRVVTGVNLAMLITVNLGRNEETSLTQLVESAESGGVEGIYVLPEDQFMASDEAEEYED